MDDAICKLVDSTASQKSRIPIGSAFPA